MTESLRPSETESVARPTWRSFSISHVLFVNMMSPMPMMSGNDFSSTIHENTPVRAM